MPKRSSFTSTPRRSPTRTCSRCFGGATTQRSARAHNTALCCTAKMTTHWPRADAPPARFEALAQHDVDEETFLASTASAKANAYVSGHGSAAQLDRGLPQLQMHGPAAAEFSALRILSA